MKRSSMRMVATGVVFSCFASLAATVSAEEFNLGNRPWDFSQQNRAGIAAMMVQKRNGTLGGDGNGVAGGGNACGGNGGSSTAVGNYTCIILNDSTAQIEQLQSDHGDQTANAQTQTVSHGNMSDVLQDLAN
jgi:hypothetical protein